jgi:hypothetical protein
VQTLARDGVRGCNRNRNRQKQRGKGSDGTERGNRAAWMGYLPLELDFAVVVVAERVNDLRVDAVLVLAVQDAIHGSRRRLAERHEVVRRVQKDRIARHDGVHFLELVTNSLSNASGNVSGLNETYEGDARTHST